MNRRAGSGLILGVDLGGTTLVGGVVDTAGIVWRSRAVPMDRLGGGEGILKNLLELAGKDPDRIEAPLVFAAAARGDPVAVSVVAKAAQAPGRVVRLRGRLRPEADRPLHRLQGVQRARCRGPLSVRT